MSPMVQRKLEDAARAPAPIKPTPASAKPEVQLPTASRPDVVGHS